MAAGLSAQTQAMPASIPVIDLGGLYSDDPAARKLLGRKPAPEFEAWLAGVGLLDAGASRALPQPLAALLEGLP